MAEEKNKTTQFPHLNIQHLGPEDTDEELMGKFNQALETYSSIEPEDLMNILKEAMGEDTEKKSE